MSWASIVAAVSAVFGFLRKLAELVSFAQAKKAGRDEAIVEGRQQEDDALARTQAAMDESDKKPMEYRD